MNTTALLQALQIGLARAQPQVELPAPLQPMLPTAPEEAAARTWLAFGALDVWQRAGFVAPAAAHVAQIEPSQPETAPPCPPSAQRLLPLLFRGEFAGLLPEWLVLARRHGCRLPARFLPQLLEHGSQLPERRAAIVPVLGQRGAWLAAHNPEWGWALQDAAEASFDAAACFETGTLEQRVHALRHLRAREGAAGLQALSGTWSAEPPEVRAALLACLEVQLSLADEAFLEAALDDRRKEVRTVAQGLLAQLIESALARRAIARAQGVLAIERSEAGVTSLVVTLLQARDKAAQRDGVGAVSHSGLGEKAGWLADMLAAVPPDHWGTRFGMGAQDCLLLAAGTEFGEAIVAGWSTATERHLPRAGEALADWFNALAQHYFLAGATLRWRYPRAFFSACVHLPPPARERFLSALINRRDAGDIPNIDAITVLKELARDTAGPWSAALSTQLFALVRAGVNAWHGYSWEFANALPAFAGVIDPRAVHTLDHDVNEGWPTGEPMWEHWEKPIDEFLRTLRFRYDMISSFQELPN